MTSMDTSNGEVPPILPIEKGDFEKVDEVRELALAWHDEFGQKWGKRSFHNKDHIKAVEKAVEITLGKIDTDDILNLKGGLSRWNHGKEAPQKLNLVEMEAAIKIAVYTHDLGNIMGAVDVTGDASLNPKFLNSYKAEGSEVRSKSISRDIMVCLGFSEASVSKILPLVQHLIEETTFDFKNRSFPFSSFMRIVDQLGNYFFNKTDFQNGLLEEKIGENPNAIFTPSTFFNFATERLPYLIPDLKRQYSVLNLWGMKMPRDKTTYQNHPVLARKYLEENKL